MSDDPTVRVTTPREKAVMAALADALHDDAVANKDTDLEAALGWMTDERWIIIARKVLEAADAE